MSKYEALIARLDAREWPALSVDLAVDVLAAQAIRELEAENAHLKAELKASKTTRAYLSRRLENEMLISNSVILSENADQKAALSLLRKLSVARFWDLGSLRLAAKNYLARSGAR